MGRATNHLRVADGKNPFGGVGGNEYDPKGFYVRSVNAHDHTAQTRVSMHPDVKAQIDTLIATGKLVGTPVNGYPAFMRNAAVHELHRLGGLLDDPEIQAIAQRQMALAKADMMAEEMKRLTSTVHEARERLTTAMNANDRRGVADYLDLYDVVLPTLRDPYRTELSTTLDSGRSFLGHRR